MRIKTHKKLRVLPNGLINPIYIHSTGKQLRCNMNFMNILPHNDSDLITSLAHKINNEFDFKGRGRGMEVSSLYPYQQSGGIQGTY